MRSIFTFALTALITALLWVVFIAQPTQAATNATWTDGDAILFDYHAYNRDDAINAKSDAIPEGAAVYKAPIESEGTSQKLMVIYFASGTDPPAATTATHLTFDYDNGDLSNPQTANITMTPQGSDDTLAGETNSSCSVDGIGWMICPISVFLAESMDLIYKWIEGFVVTPPLMLETENNGVYTAWNVARSLANLAFVIVFLIIIYSQLTSLGVSNYGLKKLTPRLIVAAVLVNLSFYISAIAIDVSNIIGSSIVDIFTGIRESTFQLTNDNFGNVNDEPWSYITTIALAGGGVIGGLYYVITSPFVLVVMLVGLAFVALVVLLILAARQAIITLLVIVSPLAFVANLLPNTEKWFDRWRDLFTTMLIFFPAFAFVFGGSQLAGQLIIQNANGNIITVILGLGVQVAPLVVTPWLLKLSGGLLGRIAQIANNPSKGLMDRTKGWANEKNQIHMRRLQQSRGSAPFTFFENNRRARKSQLERYQNMADAKWEQSKRAQKLAEGKADSEEVKSRVHSEHAEHLSKLKAGTGHRLNKRVDLHVRALESEQAKAGSEAAEAHFGAITSEFRSGQYDTQGNQRLSAIQQNMAKHVMETTAFKRAAEGASMMQQYEYAKEINTTTPQTFAGGKTLQEIAAGIDPNGAQRAQASATSVIQEIRAKTIKNMSEIISSKYPTPAEILELAKGNAVRGIQPTQDAVAAALQMTFSGPATDQIVYGLRDIDLSFTGPQYAGFTPDQQQELRVLAAKAIMGNGSKPPFTSAGIMGKLEQGVRFDGTPFTGALGQTGLNDMIVSVVDAGKVDSGKLQSAGRDYAEALRDALKSPSASTLSDMRKAELFEQLEITLDPSREAFEKLGDSKDALKELRDLLRP